MEIPRAPEKERFMQATDRYIVFLEGYQVTHKDAAQGSQYLQGLMKACSKVRGAAQMYDFTQKDPGLRGTTAEDCYGIELLEALTEPAVPREVSDIYIELYGEDLQKYLEPGVI